MKIDTIVHTTLALLLILLPRCSVAGGSKSGGGSHAFDIGTKSGLTSLYNERVTSAEKVTRPLDSFGGKSGIPHAGVRVTTESGNQYLVHKGPDFGKSSQTVVVDAQHMSSKWTGHGAQPVGSSTVSDFVKSGGSRYNPVTDNCIHGANRMMKQNK